MRPPHFLNVLFALQESGQAGSNPKQARFAPLLPVGRQSAQNLTKLAHVVKPQAFVWGKSLGAEIAALCERGDAIGGAIGQRLNGQSGLAAAGSHEAAAIAKK
jgi:hypothetical protein